MLKSDLERLFRVEFFTIVFAIIVAVILLPFIPMLIGFALGTIVIIVVIAVGIFIITQFPDLIINAIIFVVGFVIVGLVIGFFQNLKYSREQKIKGKKEAIYTKSSRNLSLDEKEKLKRQRNYLDEKEVKKLVEKNKLSKVGIKLNKSYQNTKNDIQRAKEEKIKKEEEERQKKEEERQKKEEEIQKEKQRILKIKEEKLLIINTVKEIQKEIEKNEKTHTYDGKIDLAKWPLIKDRINFKYEEESITINFYGHFPNMEIKFPFDSKFFEVHIKLKTSDLGTYSKERFEYINDVNNFVVEKIGELWAKYKKDTTSQ